MRYFFIFFIDFINRVTITGWINEFMYHYMFTYLYILLNITLIKIWDKTNTNSKFPFIFVIDFMNHE